MVDGTGNTGGTPGGEGAAGAGAGTGGEGKPWYDGFQDPSVKEWLTAYNGAYPNAEAVAMKALNLEKFIGADKAGRGIVLPKDGAKPEEWAPIWRKLGAPEKPDGYKIPEALAKDPMMLALREHAHKMGMPAPFLEGVVNWYTDQMKVVETQHMQEFEQRGEKELEELRTDWGAEYDAKTEMGRRAAAQFIPHSTPQELEQTILKMEGALGTKFTMNFFASIGKGLTEHGFVSGDTPTGGGMTPEGARLRIQDLRRDEGWVKKFSAGDVDAMAEWTRLHKIGYPEQKKSG